MPIYEFKCEDGHLLEIVMSYENSKKEFPCCLEFGDGTFCNKKAIKQVSRTSMHSDKHWHKGLYSLALDKEFKNDKEMETYLKNNNLSVAKSNDITTKTSYERILQNAEKLTPIREKTIHQLVKDFA